MRLIEIVENLKAFDAAGTIYVKDPWGPDSPAVVEIEPESGELPAAAAEMGMSYFLEVPLARQVLEGWIQGQHNTPTLKQKCERIIKYARLDA